MKKRSKSFTPEDVPMLQAMIDSDPVGTAASLGRKLNRSGEALWHWGNANGLKFKAHRKKTGIKAPGVAGRLFRECDEAKINSKKVAEELQVAAVTISQWRAARSPVPFYAVEGMCTMLGYRIVLEKI